MAMPENLEAHFPLEVYESFARPEFLAPLVQRYRSALTWDSSGWRIAAITATLAFYGPDISIPLLRELFLLPHGKNESVPGQLLSIANSEDWSVSGSRRHTAMQALFEVATKAKDPRYDTLLWRLWEEDGLVPFYTIDGPDLEAYRMMARLEASDSVRAAQLYQLELQRHPRSLLGASMDDSIDSLKAVAVGHMLRLTEAEHPGFAERWLVEQIPRADNVDHLILERLLPGLLRSTAIQEAMLGKIASTRSQGELYGLGTTLAMEGSPRVLTAVESAIRRNARLDTTHTATELRAFLRDSVRVERRARR